MSDPNERLMSLSDKELEALANSKLSPAAQNRLDDLLGRNAELQLSADEQSELDRILEQVDHLNILKARARYTLRQQETESLAT